MLVKPVADTAALAMALIENIQREDLNPLEAQASIAWCASSTSHEQAAQAIGRSRSATTNLLRLLNLSPPVQELLLGGQIDMGHARALLATDAATQGATAHRIVARGLSVREAETLVAHRGQPPARRKATAGARNRDIVRLEELSDALGSTVRLAMKAKGGGRLIIEFADLDQLDGIAGRIRGG